jgi:methionyl-tRNA formyltransferase
MDFPSLRIVFMGTPSFAVKTLETILDSHHQVVGVVTAMDKPAGRGKKIKQSDVTVFAKEQGLNVLQPENLKDEQFVAQLESLKADLFVVVAFRMLPAVIWAMPPKGTINLHASLLPHLRGAAPINWAIMNGLTETGVTTFFINEVIDTGKIIDQRKVSIGENMNCGELHDVLKNEGAQLLLETINQLSRGGIQALEQETNVSTEAPKIFKKDCEINWNNKSLHIHNQIRGLSPYPAAWCILYNRKKQEQFQFKLLASELNNQSPKSDSKQLILGENGILFPCSDGYIAIQELQAEGKTRMNYKAFIAGNDVSDWELIKN